MRLIYVDDEKILLENFQLTVKGLSKIYSLETFNRGEDALKWAEHNPVDVAFLDIEMPVMNGIELAKRLKQVDENIRIVFVTAFDQYALQAFGVEAIGYLLKPYTREDIERELTKASYIRRRPKKEIMIRTMPDLMIFVDGKPLSLGHTKQEELLALLIDRGAAGITKGDAISCLWPEKTAGDSIYWTTMSRLKERLDAEDLSDLIVTKGQTKCINTELVECDLYRILEGDKEALFHYEGAYLRRFSWAEERNAQLDQIKKGKVTEKSHNKYKM